MAHEGDFPMEKMVTIEFEPAGWRVMGDEVPAMGLEQAFDEAVYGLEVFLEENAPSELAFDFELFEPEHVGQQFVHAVLPARLVPELEGQSFVGREYPDQVKSTLKILSPR